MRLEDSETEKEMLLTSCLLSKQNPEIELIISNDLRDLLSEKVEIYEREYEYEDEE